MATSTTYPTFPPTVDLTNANPRLMFTASPKTADDDKDPIIFDMVSLPDGRLVMADLSNCKVKVMELSVPPAVTSLNVNEVPRRLVLLSDGQVAVTTCTPVICFLTVTDTVEVASCIPTDMCYWGIAGLSEGHLLVSCMVSPDGPARLDIVARNGEVIRTVTDSNKLPRMYVPNYLCNTGDNHVLISDNFGDRIYKINISSGQVRETIQRRHFDTYDHMCMDSAGQLYVVGGYNQYLFAMDRQGEWRDLLNVHEHGVSGSDMLAICLTPSGHLVLVRETAGRNSVVTCYRLT